MIGLSRTGFRKDYSQNQAKWIARIAGVNQRFIPTFNNNLSLTALYTILGQERNQIAQELGQGLLDRYGVLRKRDKPGREFFLEEDAIIAKEKVKRVVDNLYNEAKASLKPIRVENFTSPSIYFKETPNQRGVDSAVQSGLKEDELIVEGLKFYAQRLPEPVQKKQAEKFAQGVTVIDAVKGCTHGALIPIGLQIKDFADLTEQELPSTLRKDIVLSHLHLFTNDMDFKTAILIYGSISLKDSTKDSNDQLLIKICEAYIKKASHEKDPNKCKTYVAKILFMLAHMMPIKRGNASAVEVIINSIAQKAGHTFCLRLNENDLNWDIQALFGSHTMSDYVNWFNEHCHTLTPKAGKVLKALKSCEASIAQQISAEANTKLNDKLNVTQKLISLFVAKSDSYAALMIAFNDLLGQYQPNSLVCETGDTILNYLAKALYTPEELKTLNVITLTRELEHMLASQDFSADFNELIDNFSTKSLTHPNLANEYAKTVLYSQPLRDMVTQFKSAKDNIRFNLLPLDEERINISVKCG